MLVAVLFIIYQPVYNLTHGFLRGFTHAGQQSYQENICAVSSAHGKVFDLNEKNPISLFINWAELLQLTKIKQKLSHPTHSHLLFQNAEVIL